jgi:hypothetical protein
MADQPKSAMRDRPCGQAPVSLDRPCDPNCCEAPMSAILMIVIFLAVIVGLNIAEFGRPD